ncbi:putative copper-binding protein [Pseudomonas sp. 8Z]|uniref:SCO family protein n=1 Tax=Pseudomonas sp. 8Z TaxID=2653166 RepID=UPI0012EF4AD9|nr:SCO family protein [Pseudomonas sp. 8Z]VXC88806.1 putative copper-binding protein [Pseudomonas sp. 8Z]
MTRTHTIVFVLVAAVALALGLAVNQVLSSRSNPAALLDAGIVLLPQPRTLPALSMTNQDGQTTPVNAFKDDWTLLFFGYTFCPDICPATLAQLRQLQGQLPEATRERLRIVLVSVDPHRDTPEQLKKYLGYFDPSFQGLTGEEANLQKLANAVSIPYIPADTSKENYTVDHSGNLVIIGPDGTQRGFIRAPVNIAKLAKQLPELISGN